MKRFFEYLGLGVLIIGSFYYTDKATMMIRDRNPIMIEINKNKIEKKISSVNGVIENDTIIPGLVGKEVNEISSFMNMKKLGEYNESYLVFNNITPNVSIDNNKDKIIIKGNKLKKSVSLLFEKQNNLTKYIEDNNIKADILVQSLDDINYNFELINYSDNNNDFININTVLNNKKANKKICVLNNENKKFCQKNGNYLVKSSFNLTNTNFLDIKNDIKSGAIILIKRDVLLVNLKLLLNEISFKDLSIDYLSNLISEKR